MKDTWKQELRLLYDSKAQSQNGKRITYLDMTRGIAILLVVYGHSEFIGPACNIWLSSFHLPAFFVLSGILMQLKSEDRLALPDILLRKLKGIMLPYLWFSLGSLGIDFIQVLRGNFTWDILWEHVIQTVSLQGYSVLWFLPVIFFAEVMIVVVFKACNGLERSGRYGLVMVTASITCLALGAYYGYQRLLDSAMPVMCLYMLRILVKALIGAAFMSYGYVFGYVQSRIAGKTGSWYMVVVGIALCGVNILVSSHIRLMDFNQLILWNPLVYLGLGTTGSFGCILICKCLPNIPILTFLGQNSLIIMCTHLNFYILHIGMVLCRNLLSVLSVTGRIPYVAGSLICAMILSIPVILFIRICFPFVLGRRYQR